MKELSKNLEIAIKKLSERPENKGNEQLIARMLDTIDRMADGLRPAVRQSYYPIGNNCDTLTIAGEHGQATYSQTDKNNVASLEKVYTETKSYDAHITELDINSGACKLSLIGDNSGKRIAGKITDPIITQPNNPYAEALSSQTIITLVAKAEMTDGKIKKLHISDAQAKPLD